ncbi:hypothetical protein EKH55_4355 [Sinorhizobium alkalisoli]|nr:hypothetical protein EKH55_4355 [Sinorhizobium alkalisoli]
MGSKKNRRHGDQEGCRQQAIALQAAALTILGGIRNRR